MPDTNAQKQSTKGQAIRAKANIHLAMAIFTQHWGLLLQLLGEETCESNDRGNAWRDFYDGVDRMGHESITDQGKFADDKAETRLGEMEELGADLELYLEKWEDFDPGEEQAAAFNEAMELLNEVDTALDEATKFIEACLPKAEPEAGQDQGRTAPEPEPEPRP